MIPMREVQTTDLEGPALAWALGVVDGRALEVLPSEYGTGPRVFVLHGQQRVRWRPDCDWDALGQLLVGHGPRLGLELRLGESSASFVRAGMRVGYTANSVLIAAGRALVGARLGDVVQVPAALVSGQGEVAHG